MVSDSVKRGLKAIVFHHANESVTTIIPLFRTLNGPQSVCSPHFTLPLGQCKTIVFHHANEGVTAIIPLFLTLKTMVRSLHFTLPCLVFYTCMYALITLGDVQIKFETNFL